MKKKKKGLDYLYFYYNIEMILHQKKEKLLESVEDQKNYLKYKN